MTNPTPAHPTDFEVECVELSAKALETHDIEVAKGFIMRMCAAASNRNELERENEKLRAALKPFAKLIECYEAFHGRTFGDNASLSDLGSELDEVTVGDLRRAVAALGGDHE